ncbi:MAG: type I methionyl aminopeptidase [Myxococcota bacterium]
MASVELMTKRMVDNMREACQLAADTLVMIGEHVKPGITTDELNTIVHRYTVEHGARPAPLNYKGFPKSICTSINEVICHGIPEARALVDGDIINIDITSVLPAKHGYYGDNSATFYVGEPSAEAKKVVEVARRCLELGMEQVRPRGRLGDIGAAIQEYAESQGCSVVRDYVGHGIGRSFHMPPQVPHYGRRNTLLRMKPGMVFTIEPMINIGNYTTELLNDGWTVVTRDRSLSAQFEHTVVVTRGGCEVLTRRHARLANSEDVPWAQLGPLSCWMESGSSAA